MPAHDITGDPNTYTRKHTQKNRVWKRGSELADVDGALRRGGQGKAAMSHPAQVYGIAVESSQMSQSVRTRC